MENVNKQLLDALKELVSIVEIHSKATDNNFAWAEIDFANEAIAAAEQAQQVEPVARDVLAAFGIEVKHACVKAWGTADECEESRAIRDCDITAIVDRYAAQSPAVAVTDGWRDAMERAAEDLEDNNCLESAHQLRAMLAAASEQPK